MQNKMEQKQASIKAQEAALEFTLDGDTDKAWFASDKLVEELSRLGRPIATDFNKVIRRRQHVLIGFKDDRTNMACIYLGLCGNGSRYHESFKLGDVGTALVFCEPSVKGGKHHLDFAPIPLSQLRFIAGLAQLDPHGKAHRLKARKYSAAERKELRMLEHDVWSTPIPPFNGDSSGVELVVEKMRARLRAIFASRAPLRVDGNGTVH
jgi:hypothetical protein